MVFASKSHIVESIFEGLKFFRGHFGRIPREQRLAVYEHVQHAVDIIKILLRGRSSQHACCVCAVSACCACVCDVCVACVACVVLPSLSLTQPGVCEWGVCGFLEMFLSYNRHEREREGERVMWRD